MEKKLKTYSLLFKMIGFLTILTGVLVAGTSWMFPVSGQPWYTIGAWILGAFTIASGFIVMITAKFERYEAKK